jgi:hypothetical protein
MSRVRVDGRFVVCADCTGSSIDSLASVRNASLLPCLRGATSQFPMPFSHLSHISHLSHNTLGIFWASHQSKSM